MLCPIYSRLGLFRYSMVRSSLSPYNWPVSTNPYYLKMWKLLEEKKSKISTSKLWCENCMRVKIMRVNTIFKRFCSRMINFAIRSICYIKVVSALLWISHNMLPVIPVVGVIWRYFWATLFYLFLCNIKIKKTIWDAHAD